MGGIRSEERCEGEREPLVRGPHSTDNVTSFNPRFTLFVLASAAKRAPKQLSSISVLRERILGNGACAHLPTTISTRPRPSPTKRRILRTRTDTRRDQRSKESVNLLTGRHFFVLFSLERKAREIRIEQHRFE